ncbi:MAG: hypothetical protein HRU00_13180 [Myxococcales bacterium]|nr:hypothetical protein [Myxococcales bacterium]
MPDTVSDQIGKHKAALARLDLTVAGLRQLIEGSEARIIVRIDRLADKVDSLAQRVAVVEVDDTQTIEIGPRALALAQDYRLWVVATILALAIAAALGASPEDIIGALPSQ